MKATTISREQGGGDSKETESQKCSTNDIMGPKDMESQSTIWMANQDSLWVNFDDVPSHTNVKITVTPKSIDSNLCQRMYQICLIFLASFPRMKPIPPHMVEFFTCTMSDTMKLLMIQSKPRTWWLTIFIVPWPYAVLKIMSSQDSVTKLGTKGGFKKKKPALFGDKIPSHDCFWVVHHNRKYIKKLNALAFSQNHQVMRHFYRLKNNMVKFFFMQFDRIQDDKSSSIKGGCRMTVTHFLMQYHIVAACCNSS